MSVLERVQQQDGWGAAEDAPMAPVEVSALREKLKRDLVDRLGLATVAALVGSGDVSHARRELEAACQAIVNTKAFEHCAGARRGLRARAHSIAPRRRDHHRDYDQRPLGAAL